jgi:leucyl/phenylalanyl-tRNA--protein transferase
LSLQSKDRWFPPVEHASPEGLLAIGGDLSSERLLEAYKLGIFPWYSQGQPILWWSPDPRAVLYPRHFSISRSLKKNLRNRSYHVTIDSAFEQVINRCAAPRRKEPLGGTWITPDMINAYLELHQLGYAHSVETWNGPTLVGGLYGVSLGATFFGESMFSTQTDASKVALVYLVRLVQRWDFHFIDCQVPSPHVMRLGAESVPRERFLGELAAALSSPDRIGRWRFPRDTAITRR